MGGETDRPVKVKLGIGRIQKGESPQQQILSFVFIDTAEHDDFPSATRFFRRYRFGKRNCVQNRAASKGRGARIMIGTVLSAENYAISDSYCLYQNQAQSARLFMQVQNNPGAQPLGDKDGGSKHNTVDVNNIDPADKLRQAEVEQEPVDTPDERKALSQALHLDTLPAQFFGVDPVVGKQNRGGHPGPVQRPDQSSHHRRDSASAGIMHHV